MNKFMHKNESDEINDLLGFEIIDKNFNISDHNADKFITQFPPRLDKPNERIKKNIQDLWLILETICWKRNIFPASLQEINKARGAQQSFPLFTIPVFDISHLDFKNINELVNSILIGKNKLAAFSFDLNTLDSSDLLIQISKILSATLINNYEGPLFLLAANVKFDANNFENNREALLENLKRKTQNAIQLGLYNINYDSSDLINVNGSQVSEKMLMNLKMVALATNLWVRNFQPKGVVVSVCGKMGLLDNRLPSEGELKEYLQRLLKEGSRLRFGVAGDDISKVQLSYSKLDSAAIEQINQLDLFSRREFKLSGVVVDAGEVKDMEEYNLISKLTVCELMMNLGENIISKNNLLTIIKKCGVDQIPFDIKRYSPKPSKMPEIEELQF